MNMVSHAKHIRDGKKCQCRDLFYMMLYIFMFLVYAMMAHERDTVMQ